MFHQELDHLQHHAVDERTLLGVGVFPSQVLLEAALALGDLPLKSEVGVGKTLLEFRVAIRNLLLNAVGADSCQPRCERADTRSDDGGNGPMMAA
jgi:hypothetical protein